MFLYLILLGMPEPEGHSKTEWNSRHVMSNASETEGERRARASRRGRAGRLGWAGEKRQRRGRDRAVRKCRREEWRVVSSGMDSGATAQDVSHGMGGGLSLRMAAK